MHAAVNGREVVTHLADPGRLKELLVPGRRMGLRPELPSTTRKTRWTSLLVESPDGAGWVSLNTTMPNRLILNALQVGALEEFDGWSYAAREVRYGESRLDFLLERDGRRLYIEAKSVTLVEDGVALFNLPADQITAAAVPIDAVIYGAANSSGLLDPTGVAGTTDVAGAAAGSSIERTADGWRVQAAPTPGVGAL